MWLYYCEFMWLLTHIRHSCFIGTCPQCHCKGILVAACGMIFLFCVISCLCVPSFYVDVKWFTPRGTPRSLQWRHNGCDGVTNHQPHDCLLNRLFRHRSKKTSKLRVTDLCVGYSPGTGEFLAQMASNAENVSIWWRRLVCDSWLSE